VLNFGPLWKGISVGSDALKGPFIFYEVGGGLVGFEGGHAKNMASKGGPAKKIRCVKGGSPKNCLYV